MQQKRFLVSLLFSLSFFAFEFILELFLLVFFFLFLFDWPLHRTKKKHLLNWMKMMDKKKFRSVIWRNFYTKTFFFFVLQQMKNEILGNKLTFTKLSNTIFQTEHQQPFILWLKLIQTQSMAQNWKARRKMQSMSIIFCRVFFSL